MKNLIVLVLLCALAGLGSAATHTQKHRKTLAEVTEIQGYSCAKGYAWFYPDGRLASCTIAQDTEFGVAKAPAGSWITLTADGKPMFLGLSHNTPILGYTCLGGSFLGPSEGASTAFYPSGKLKQCWLAGDQEVQGIPCRGSGMFSGDSGVQFYESGKLHTCEVSKKFGNLQRRQRFTQEP